MFVTRYSILTTTGLIIILLASSYKVKGQYRKDTVTATSNKRTLSFAYKESPATPVKEEWIATITRRDKNQVMVVEQKMTESRHYESGNYHIEINTLPKDIRNVDLDSNIESVIAISQPGFAKFVCIDSNKKTATLFRRLGNEYYSFYTLDLNNPISQHLQIQPGEYKVDHRTSITKKSTAFSIKPDKETIVEIK